MYYGGNDLGAVTEEGRTSFKLWSPGAEHVTLCFYADGGDGPVQDKIPMESGEDGVWSVSFPENLHGVYYDYEIRRDGKTVRTADPYAKACGVNGSRSMAVDLRRTDPEGWEQDAAPAKRGEDIIYEVHVKEFSWDERGGFRKDHRGKYLAFTEEGTTLDGDGVHPTGISYLKELGVTHIQLMPVFDYGSVDEGRDADPAAFNWGYDPVNYNVPEGSYSSDAGRGEVRIRELKELVGSLHRNGFRVIMDVVYNHTYSEDSWLSRTVPGYYYRYQEDGSLTNGSACGNDVASERPMCGRYILDSVMYWAGEYHMDGFRFDLMGLLDVELMNRIQSALDARFGAGEKLVYGEPWAAAVSPMEGDAVPALKENIEKLDDKIAVFCDSTRDSIRGHVFEAEIPGFVNGGEGLESAILESVRAWCGFKHDKGFRPKAPSQIISYVSAHDNLTLWDKLMMTMEPDSGFTRMPEAVLKANQLAAAIYFTCQGHIFMLSGEEFGRTKQGDENSFRSPISLNCLDWGRAYENRELVEYYRGLIALRFQLPGLCDKSETAFRRITERKIEAPGCVSFCVDNEGETHESRWKRLLIAYNAGEKSRRIRLPEGTWSVLMADGDSWLWKREDVVAEEKFAVSPTSAVILGCEE